MKRVTALARALGLFGVLMLGGAGDAASQGTLPSDDEFTELDVEDELRKRERAAIESQRLKVTVPQEGPIDPARYMLGPGDLLQLDLWGRVLRSVALEVSPEGKVFLPGSGPIDVANRSLAWARNRILQQVAESFRGVHADVRLLQLRTFKVHVSGFGKKPGPVEVTSVTRASEAVRQAELQADGSRRNIEVRRRDGAVLDLDLDHADAVGNFSANPQLVDGDVIHVPRATTLMEVTGAVGRTGRMEYTPRDSLSTIIALAGGLLESAVPDSALLIRFKSANARESLWVNLRDVLSRHHDVPARDGDRLFVPFQAEYHVLTSAAIYGEVNKPGAHPIVPGVDRFSDLVRWAGGFRPLANRSGMLLVRENRNANEKDPEFDRLVRLSRSEMTESEYTKFQTKLAERTNSFRVDWSRLQSQGHDVDPLLQPGDLVRVDLLVPSVRIEGEVRRPGFVDFLPGRTLREYVELAGGYTDRASRRGARISRALTGQVLPGRSVRAIQPGDFIWVPERTDVNAWQVFRDAVAVAGQVAVIIFTLSR